MEFPGLKNKDNETSELNQLKNPILYNFKTR